MPLLLTTQDQVVQTVAGVANYGGSLDVILDDADRRADDPVASWQSEWSRSSRSS